MTEMQYLLSEASKSFATALVVYFVIFSMYKGKHANKPFKRPFIILLLSVAASLLMAKYGSKALVFFVAAPLYLLSILVYPLLSSLVLLRKAPAKGSKRWLIFALGVLSSVIYHIIFLLLLSAREPITEANL